MKEKTLRIYVETSVVSGMFDKNDHPQRATLFWNAVRNGVVRIIVSDMLIEEIGRAPQHVRDFLDSVLMITNVERIASTIDSNNLAMKYIAEGIVSQNSLNDCKHVALASVADADVLVSFNCKHIVKLNRIYRYNAINQLLGYRSIEIRTPEEVIDDHF